MDYEKLHKDTITKLQEMVNSGKITAEIARGICADFVPESEDEDERIRKAIIKHFEKERKKSRKVNYYGVDVFDILAWLEKQGEHANFRNKIQIGDKVTRNEDGVLVNLSQLKRVAKPADKVEPKFKIGDIIRLKDGDGLEWTVEGVLNNGYYTIVCADRDDFIQLDDKWELVEQKPAWSEEDKDVIDTIIWTLIDREVKEGHPDEYEPEVNWLKSLKGRLHPKQKWSKLDNRIEDCIGMCLTDISEKRFDDFKTSLKECLDWLHSLKDRIWYQPTQEWSEEDKRKIYRIYSILRQAADTHAFSTSCRLIGDKECIELQDFLKSLIPQKQWKPSDEQMDALNEAIYYVDDSVATQLSMLIGDLKKLN